MSASHDRTPSPPPPPPIPLTPGPRAAKFATLFSSALTKTLSTVSLSKFSACFPTPARHCPHILASVHSQIIQGVEERARREFDEILKERDVVAGLNELERLAAEASGRRERGVKEGKGVGEAWEFPRLDYFPLDKPNFSILYSMLNPTLQNPHANQTHPYPFSPHTLPPQQLYLAHLAPYLSATETQLLSSLSTTQAENSELALQIQSQWEEAETLLSGLEKVISDLEAANETMGESVELVAKSRRNELIEVMEVTEDGGVARGPRLWLKYEWCCEMRLTAGHRRFSEELGFANSAWRD